MNQDIQDALEQYMPAKGYKTYDDYILDYYRKPDGSKYDSVSELLKNDPKALKELSRSGSSMPNDPNTGNNTVKMDPSTLYDNFYQNVLSFKVGDPKRSIPRLAVMLTTTTATASGLPTALRKPSAITWPTN